VTGEEMVRGYGKIEKARWKLVRLFVYPPSFFSPPKMRRADGLSDLRYAEVSTLPGAAWDEECVFTFALFLPFLRSSLERETRFRVQALDANSSSLPPAVQCTKGKCTKAYHVTCALALDSGIKMDATVPDPDHPGETMSILDAALEIEEMDRAAAAGERAETPEVVKKEGGEGGGEPKSPVKQIADADNDLIQLTVLCRTHNPVRFPLLLRSFFLPSLTTLLDCLAGLPTTRSAA
jgi:hypothetical protein